MQQLICALQEVLGPGGVLTGDEARSRSGSWGVMHCDAPAVLRPRSTAEVAAVLRLCHAAGQAVVTGRAPTVSGTVPITAADCARGAGYPGPGACTNNQGTYAAGYDILSIGITGRH